MLLGLLSVLGMILAPKDTRAQSITQPDSHVTLSEGASLELRCNYSYGATPYLFWYIQYPGQGLQLLLKHISGDALVKGINGFEAEFKKKDTRAQSITQPDSHVTLSEGASLELRCNYSYGATPYLFWYIQYPGQGLQLLLKHISGDTLVKGINGFEAEFKKSESSFHLRKPSVHWIDTAEYFCALSDTVLGAAGGAARKPCEMLGRITASERFWTPT
ncbi:T-cell receptor alpha chain V region PHDS58 [Tupaia chinensis]|nr:T-cell receptor alpha chain V region PHDS58 [Tupaia chinensis]